MPELLFDRVWAARRPLSGVVAAALPMDPWRPLNAPHGDGPPGVGTLLVPLAASAGRSSPSACKLVVLALC